MKQGERQEYFQYSLWFDSLGFIASLNIQLNWSLILALFEFQTFQWEISGYLYVPISLAFSPWPPCGVGNFLCATTKPCTARCGPSWQWKLSCLIGWLISDDWSWGYTAKPDFFTNFTHAIEKKCSVADPSVPSLGSPCPVAALWASRAAVASHLLEPPPAHNFTKPPFKNDTMILLHWVMKVSPWAQSDPM